MWQTRWVLKPLVFAACLLPALHIGLGALNAAETALSIMSEIIAVRHGRSGGRLLEARGRIHAAVPA